MTLFTYCKYRNARQNLSNVLQCIRNEGWPLIASLVQPIIQGVIVHRGFVLAMKIQGMDVWIIAVGFQIHFTKPANHWFTILWPYYESVCKPTDLPSVQKLPWLIDCWSVLTREDFHEMIKGTSLNLPPLCPCNLGQYLIAG